MTIPLLDLTHVIVKDCWVDHHDRTDSYIHGLLKVRNMERLQKEGKEDPQLVEPEGITVYLAGHMDTVTVLPPNAIPDVEAPDKNSSYFRPCLHQQNPEFPTAAMATYNHLQ
jgi:hypothetical protein